MKSLSQYIIESSSDKAVNNTKFRKLMKAAGLEDIKLVKGQGYFYITSDDIEIWKKIYELPETNIYINSFNQMPPEDWVKEIERLIESLDILESIHIHTIEFPLFHSIEEVVDTLNIPELGRDDYTDTFGDITKAYINNYHGYHVAIWYDEALKNDFATPERYVGFSLSPHSSVKRKFGELTLSAPLWNDLIQINLDRHSIKNFNLGVLKNTGIHPQSGNATNILNTINCLIKELSSENKEWELGTLKLE